MDKLKMHSPDMTQQNIEKIQALFPNCVTESRGADGKIKLAIDFDQLKQELSNSIVEGPQERYQLNWPGKREALLTANAPIAKTLRPCREESVNFDTTENLFIEGDNLDALKLLQEAYLGKVKMIYIDPPYNTGNDFIYEDDFAENSEDFLKRSNQRDEEGNRLIANTEANGRFHSDWLSMMYSRLKLARNLLRDDGVIFISIDDNEQSNIKNLSDEIFGESNYYCHFIWQKRSGSMDSVNGVSTDHEYVLVYGKSKTRLAGVLRTYEKYTNPDNDPRGPWISDNLSAGKAGGDVDYPITDPDTGNVFYPPKGRYWPYNPKTMLQKIEEGRVLFPKNKDGRPMLKRFQNEAKSQYLPVSTILRNHTDKVIPSNAITCAMNTKGTAEIQELFDGKFFSFPKSTILLKSLIGQVSFGDDIFLDFFAGSSTTAHAVLQLNAEDGGNRKFIMVQLAEECDKKSEAFKAGYKTIAEISKERIRRAGAKILAGECHKDWNKDIGFRVLKVDTSNMADVYYSPDQVSQGSLDLLVDNIKADRTDEDLLFQVLLDWGVDLTLPIRKETIQGKSVFFVDDDALVACFDLRINEALIKELATKEPLRVVFRDDGFESDAVKINAEQIFKQVSPHTEVKAI